MEEIGLQLKQKREENSISVEEVANDLKVLPSMIESVEAGKKDDFQDVFSLKYFIRDYAKYLGLDFESILDKFNEYLFEQTSKISLSDIEAAKKEKEKKEKKLKILSPYTKTSKNKKWELVILFILLVFMLVIVSYLVIMKK